MRVIAKGWAHQQARACGFCFNHILCFTKIRAHPPSDSFAGRRHELNAHVLEVLLCFLPRVVVRQSIAWVVLTRDLLELYLPRNCFTSRCLTFPHPRRAKMPFTTEESPLIVVFMV